MTRFAIIALIYSITLTITTIEGVYAKNSRNGFISGPVHAELIRVVDGDTVLVDAEPWPNYRIRVFVRLRDIDTLELNARCADVRQKAKDAKIALTNMLNGEELQLYDISGGKYFGRILADLRLSEGESVSNMLLSSGHAVNYPDRMKRSSCSKAF